MNTEFLKEPKNTLNPEVLNEISRRGFLQGHVKKS